MHYLVYPTHYDFLVVGKLNHVICCIKNIMGFLCEIQLTLDRFRVDNVCINFLFHVQVESSFIYASYRCMSGWLINFKNQKEFTNPIIPCP